MSADPQVDGWTARDGLLAELRSWPARRWLTVLAVAPVTILVTAVPTAMIANPVFGRDVPTTWWAWPVLVASAVLAGMIAATYVARRDTADTESGSRLGVVGTVTTFFAVGCPVCNKLVLVALGYSGALRYFAPVQPLLAAIALVVLSWALVARIRRERTCPIANS